MSVLVYAPPIGLLEPKQGCPSCLVGAMQHHKSGCRLVRCSGCNARPYTEHEAGCVEQRCSLCYRKVADCPGHKEK